ncbi:MAG: hypothetical protein C4329_01370 [Chitinophagaceae bacterium]
MTDLMHRLFLFWSIFPMLFYCPSTKGLWAQALNSLNHAAKEHSFILYTEPDKYSFFKHVLSNALEQIQLADNLGVYVFSRSQKAFQTFPSFQQMTETKINRCCAEIIEKAIDYTYGPFIINGKLINHLTSLPSNIGWGWQSYSFVLAKPLGLLVESFEGDFACPLDQQTDDATERIYRMQQLAQNIESITLGAATTF